VIGRFVLADRGHDSERDADEDREQDREERQLGRCRDCLTEIGEDWLLRELRLTEVAVEQVPEVGPVLDGKGLVHPPAFVVGSDCDRVG
jgi:hypothetical protein